MDWISVKDRLPEENGVVLVYGKKDFWDCLGRSVAKFYKETKYTLAGFAGFKTVTHWMPLPEPPKAK